MRAALAVPAAWSSLSRAWATPRAPVASAARFCAAESLAVAVERPWAKVSPKIAPASLPAVAEAAAVAPRRVGRNLFMAGSTSTQATSAALDAGMAAPPLYSVIGGHLAPCLRVTPALLGLVHLVLEVEQLPGPAVQAVLVEHSRGTRVGLGDVRPACTLRQWMRGGDADEGHDLVVDLGEQFGSLRPLPPAGAPAG